jgi:hypothetical protein
MLSVHVQRQSAVVLLRQAIGKPHTLWCAFAKFYDRHGDLANARIIFEKATEVLWPAPELTRNIPSRRTEACSVSELAHAHALWSAHMRFGSFEGGSERRLCKLTNDSGDATQPEP